jgi:hypothetical protein
MQGKRCLFTIYLTPLSGPNKVGSKSEKAASIMQSLKRRIKHAIVVSFTIVHSRKPNRERVVHVFSSRKVNLQPQRKKKEKWTCGTWKKWVYFFLVGHEKNECIFLFWPFCETIFANTPPGKHFSYLDHARGPRWTTGRHPCWLPRWTTWCCPYWRSWVTQGQTLATVDCWAQPMLAPLSYTWTDPCHGGL